MRSLFVKEWLGLRPFAMLLACVWAIGVVLTLMLDFPDEYPLWDSLFAESSVTSGLLLVFAFLLAQGLLIREKQDGTLDFLDSLPLTRASVFWAKWLLALLVLLGFLLLLTVEALVYDSLSRTSLSGEFPWRSLGIWLFLQALFCVAALSLSLLLAYLRWLAFLALAMLFWLVWWMTQKGMPGAEWINPFNLVAAPGGAEDPWPLPWKHIQIQGGIAALLTFLALAIFELRDSAWSRSLTRASATRPVRAAFALCVALIPVAWISLFVTTSASLQDSAGEGPEGANEALAAEALAKHSGENEIFHHTTGHYDFFYRKRQEPKLIPLFPEADRVFQTVAEFLEVPASRQGSRVVVDLCHPLQEHFAGLAFWKKIRMTLEEKEKPAHHLAVLGHETTHVLLNLLTESRAQEDFASIRWFHEGLASYVEYRFFRSPKETLRSNRSLALAATWNQIDFEELIDDEILSKKRDGNLVYSAGRLWCEAFVDVYGEKAPARLAAAIADPSVPLHSDSLGRWRRYCQAAGFDLERVRSRFRRRLDELRQEHAERCAVFPVFAAGELSRAGKSVVLKPVLPASWSEGLPRNAHPVCRIRPDRNAPPFLYRSAPLGEDGAFAFAASNFLKPSFDYTLGWHTGEWSREPVWGEWKTAVVP